MRFGIHNNVYKCKSLVKVSCFPINLFDVIYCFLYQSCLF